jgi:hypothetical protein
MKTKMAIGLFIMLQAMLIGCNEEEVTFGPQSQTQVQTGQTETSQIATQINAFPIETISQEELTSLTIMREEEKLAQDVYVTLYNKWGKNIFDNISSSEATHTQAVLTLLVKYGIPDPVGENGVGVFQNQDLQNLYNQLLSIGSQSLLDALIVGATIEDMDILDLNDALVYIDNQDIIYVYSNLTKGSRNHLRSFYSQLLNQGYVYEAQYISQSELEEIVNSPKETGAF